MEKEELEKEVEKLNARLQKAVSVFNEQKATIARLTEERDAALAKTSEAENQDQLFFEQEQEISKLKEELKTKDGEMEGLQAQIGTMTDLAEKTAEEYNKSMGEKDAELEKLNERLKKASEEYKKQKQEIATVEKERDAYASCIKNAQGLFNEVLPKEE